MPPSENNNKLEKTLNAQTYQTEKTYVKFN